MREVVLSRNYSRFCLQHPVARSFRTWIKNTAIPDESYFQTLSRISDIVVQDNDSAEILNVTQNFDTDWDTTVHGICLRYTKWAISPGGISDYNLILYINCHQHTYLLHITICRNC